MMITDTHTQVHTDNSARNPIELAHEDRLKAIAYQFIALYERWSEDRQAAIKQMADMAELLTRLTGHAKHVEGLGPVIKYQIAEHFQVATDKAAKTIVDKIEINTAHVVEKTVHELSHSVKQAQYQLENYRTNLQTSLWRTIVLSTAITLIASAFIAWLVIPASVIKLTDTQLSGINNGMMMQRVWPELSQQEQDHWRQLADKAQSADGNNDNNGDDGS